ncbi:hypothetical protein NDU88_005354 [Pleurodeles waltl]|uniref:Uncharacterized protein n=1 Tax=Pleurodeles waltl TaxID=8319 RepID=A0AAV7PK51_PLEWA|nr:hypothetical protein NDU88_005354 [Pleurodeles waltl]
MSHSNYATRCGAKDSYEEGARADALFPRKKSTNGSPVVCEMRWRLAESWTRGGPHVRTGAAPEEGRSETRARSGRERWSSSCAPRQRVASAPNLGHV